MSKRRRTEHLNFHCKPELATALREAAQTEVRNVSELVRIICEQWLSRRGFLTQTPVAPE